MKLYKFISETEIEKYKGGFVVIDSRIYTNPKEEKIREAGFKPLAEIEKPVFDDTKEYCTVTYTDNGECITPVYTVCKTESEVIEGE